MIFCTLVVSGYSNHLFSFRPMHPYFNVSKEDIQSLDDVQARELVAKLCQAELKSNNISSAYVHWGGDQRSADGGVDVLVDII